MSRHAADSSFVEGLRGSPTAKDRLRSVLSVIAGRATVEESASLIGVRRTRHYLLTRQALQSALTALEPRVGGRPRNPGEAPLVARLKREIETLRLQLKSARVREAIALIRGEGAPTAAGRTGHSKSTRGRASRARDPATDAERLAPQGADSRRDAPSSGAAPEVVARSRVEGGAPAASAGNSGGC
jgi:hypothetical protein